MKIYTKGGDKGETSLFGGRRVKKSDLRIEAYGTIDELNSWIGIVSDQEINSKRIPFLREIQDRLFTIGSELASDPQKAGLKKPDILAQDIEKIEDEIDRMELLLPALKSFILPGGHSSVSYCHVARTVCRRAERLVIALDQKDDVNQIVIGYLNRLSDFLFVLSRMMGHELGVEEISWRPRM